MKARLRLVVFLCLTVTFLFTPGESKAQGEDGRYFAETGHIVKGDFLVAYDKAPNPQLVYGNPITEEFPIPVAGGNETVVVQYFERVRFELKPQNPPELRVEISRLGEFLHQPDPAIPVMAMAPNHPACRNFPDTNFQVCYAFLEFFDANGGQTQFGFPISDIEIRDGRMVQYFQRARFEWYPELPSGQRVVLTDLGMQYFQLYENPELMLPIPGDGIPFITLDLRVHAFADRAVLSPGDSQILYALVQNQTLRAIGQAQVTFIIRLPSGAQERYVTLADENGIATLPFSTTGQPHGIIEVLVLADYDTFHDATLTSYRIWW